MAPQTIEEEANKEETPKEGARKEVIIKIRGLVTGLMTFIGGFLHTLPFLISNVHTALTWAYAVVGIELVVIALIRHRYFKTSFALSCLQVIVGGGLVFAAGVLIGQS